VVAGSSVLDWPRSLWMFAAKRLHQTTKWCGNLSDLDFEAVPFGFAQVLKALRHVDAVPDLRQ